jgi:hypothetical protein
MSKRSGRENDIENIPKIITIRNMLNQKLEYSFDGESHIFLPYETKRVSVKFYSQLPKKYFVEIGV